MSWDILVVAAKEPPPPVANTPAGWRGDSLGSSDEVRARISACLPTTTWPNPRRGIFRSQGFSYEFNVPIGEMVESVVVQVRGRGDAVSPLLHLAQCNGWWLRDLEGEWLHHCSEPDEGWKEFQGFRDHVENVAN